MKESITETLERLAHGVEPIRGEPLRFHVQSKTRSGWKYTVDLSEFVPNGSCSCDRFLRYGLHRKLERGELCGIATTCEHIRRVGTYLRLITVSNYAALLEQGRRDEIETLLTSLNEPEPAF